MKHLTPKRLIQITISLAITALFVFLFARNIDGDQMMGALSRAHPGWIAIAVALFLAGYACRIARWREMLTVDNPRLGWSDCAGPLFASVAANNVLPLRIGDLLRVFGFSRRLAVPTAMMLASLVVERLLDLMCLLIALGGCVAFVRIENGFGQTLVRFGGIGIFILVVLVAALLLFPFAFEGRAKWGLRQISRGSPAIAARLGEFAQRMFEALRHLSRGPKMLVLFAWSGAAWAFEGLVFLATGRAIEGFDPIAGLLAFPVSTLATLLPSSPGYVGTFDFAAIKSAEALGAPTVAAAAFAFLVHLVIWLPATLLGGACLAFWTLHPKTINPFHDARMQIDA